MPDRQALMQQLDTTRAETLAALQNLDPHTIVYPDSEWTIKDIIGHLTAWEQAAISSLQAHTEGGESHLPMSDEEYNHLNVARRKNFPIEKIMADWTDTREWLKQAIEEMPLEKFESDMMYPWGKRSSVTGLIEEMIQHEIEHRNEILAVT